MNTEFGYGGHSNSDCQIEGQIGEVVGQSGEYVTVEIERHGACKHCGACFIGKGEDKFTQLVLRNSVDAQIGDQVEVDVAGKDLVKASLLLYFIPVVALVIGMLAGNRLLSGTGIGENAASVLGGVVFLAIALLILKWYDRRLREKSLQTYQPVIIRKLNH